MIATPTYALPAPQEIEPAPLLKFSFYCFCIFNLAYYSRFFEWQLWYLHVPLVTSSIALLGACRKLRSSPGEASFSRPGEAQGRPKRENPHYIIFVLHAHWADLTAEGSDSGVTIKA